MKNNQKKTGKVYGIIRYPASILLWFLIWYVAARQINNEIFLPSPDRVLKVLLVDLIPTAAFWKSLLTSLVHIAVGFLLGAMAGILLALTAAFSRAVELFCWFPIKVLKSVPVASFVILTLLWLDAEALSIFVPAMIVLPILYINTLTGMKETDPGLIEMTRLFRVPFVRQLWYLYLPEALPHIWAGASLAVGLSWKSGVAAEIIGLARNSIGNELYQAKLYFLTPELFAWTMVIVLLSILCEGVFQHILRTAKRKQKDCREVL